MKALTIALLSLGISSAFAADDVSIVYMCKPHGDSEITLEITGNRATLSGATRDGRLLDVMSYFHPDRVTKSRNPARTETFRAGKSYQPASQLVLDRRMRQSAAEGDVTLHYQDGRRPDRFSCELAETTE